MVFQHWISVRRSASTRTNYSLGSHPGNLVSDGGISKIIHLDTPTNNDGLHAHWRFDEGQGTETLSLEQPQQGG